MNRTHFFNFVSAKISICLHFLIHLLFFSYQVKGTCNSIIIAYFICKKIKLAKFISLISLDAVV